MTARRARRAGVCAAAAVVLLTACDRTSEAPSPGAVAEVPVSLPSEPLTFSTHVAPIIFENCSYCHRPDAAGPFDLLCFDDVRKRKNQIVAVTGDRFMPPWIPVPGYGPLAGERRLTDQQIALLAAWVDQGAVEGDPADLPTLPEWPKGWQLGEPDLVVRMPEPYLLAPAGEDVFRNFVISIPVTERKYVRGIEFRPDNPRIIHHADIRIDRTRGSRELDERDPGPGFDGMDAATSAEFPDGTLLGWTPGKVASLGPEDLAWRLEWGSDLVLGLHLLPSGKPEAIQASIGLYFSDRPPKRYPFPIRLGSMSMDIPAGAADYAIEDRYVLPVDVDLVSVFPHAHYLGHTMHGKARLPDGTTRWLIRIDDWDFNWQDQYTYTEPIFLPKGTEMWMRYTYDNSAANVQNPNHPPQRVVYGGKSSDEMGDLWFQVVPRTAGDHEILTQDFGRKEVAVRIELLRTRLGLDPEDFASHNAIALLYLRLGRVGEGVRHFEEAVRLNPDFGGAYYNIGLVRAAQQRHQEAIRYYRRALDAKPDLADVQNAWGSALVALNRPDAAAAHYRSALEIAPEFAPAHYNLGAIAHAKGDVDAALESFRSAVRYDPDFAAAHSTLGTLLLARGAFDEAIVHLERVAYIKPDSADAQTRLAQALMTGGESARAVGPLREALRLRPESLRLINDLAWILAAHPDAEVRDAAEAIELAERAAARTDHRYANILDTLAAAYAAAGRFDEAVATAQRAVELAPGDESIRAHQRAYLDRRPYTDPALVRRNQ